MVIAVLVVAVVALLAVVIVALLVVAVVALLVVVVVALLVVVVVALLVAATALAMRIAVPASLFGGPRTMVVEGCRGIGGAYVHWGKGGCGVRRVSGASGGWGRNVCCRGMGQRCRRGSRWLRRSRVGGVIIRVRRIGV